MTILTPSDVIQYSGINLRNNPCDYRTIFNIEYSEFRTRLGMLFYENLKTAVVNYSISIDYTGGSILKDAVVKYQGVYYVAKNDTATRPDDVTNWAVAPKFETNCRDLYNDLFCNFLAEYLALSVLFVQIPFVHDSAHSEGVVQYNGQNYKASDDKGFLRLQNAILSKKELVFQNMDSWIRENSKSDCFKNYMGILENCLCQLQVQQNAKRQGYGYDFG